MLAMNGPEGVDVAGRSRMADRCKEEPSECGPRTNANDQKLVSPGLTSRIINVGTRTATLSKTPISAARDSIVHHATRVTRLMVLDCNRIAIIKIDNGIDFPSHKSFMFYALSSM